jgi:transcriptional regulator with XRE-family HTH domain
MTYEQLANWRYRLGLSNINAAIKLGISIDDYEWYENGFSVIPKSIELAIFAIELSEYLFLKAREQNPKFRHKGIGYSYTKNDFINKLLNEGKLIQDIQLNKGDKVFVEYKKT